MANDYVNTDFDLFKGKYEDVADKDIIKYLDENKDHRNLWKGVPISKTGKARLRDGRTGEYFDSPVTVGHMHYLKLHHLVDDKLLCKIQSDRTHLLLNSHWEESSQFGGQRFVKWKFAF